MLTISVLANDQPNRWAASAASGGDFVPRSNAVALPAPLVARSRFLKLASPGPISETSTMIVVGCGLILVGTLFRKKPRPTDSGK
jgi:hypothetical protein